jgi:uncharacterized protein DUF4189
MRTFITSCLCALFLAPSVASADFDNSVPWRNLSGNSPIVITRTSTWFNTDSSIRLCVNFRNVSSKAASRVRVAFEFDDSFDRPMREAVLERSGSFGPGISIEGKMDLLGGNSDSFNNCVDNVAGTNTKPTIEKIDVTDVIFEDGTRWKKGEPFVRAFDSGGNRVAATPVASPTPSGGAPTVNIGGATAVAGSVAPSGVAFGTIAWIPGSRTAYGVSTDAASQSDADFAAMTACTQLAKGTPGCKPVVRLYGTDNKCGAIATDEAKYSTGRGPNMSATIQSVLQALAAAGGTIGGNSVIASACNTRT